MVIEATNQIDAFYLSSYPRAVSMLQYHQDKTNWHLLSSNLGIFDDEDYLCK